jgi:hypothetical protein
MRSIIVALTIIFCGAALISGAANAEDAIQSTLPLTIRGVIKSSTEGNSVVLLQDKTDGRLIVARPGSAIYRDAKLKFIESYKTVIVERFNRLEYIGEKPRPKDDVNPTAATVVQAH